jgi:hypothetical protein
MLAELWEKEPWPKPPSQPLRVSALHTVASGPLAPRLVAAAALADEESSGSPSARLASKGYRGQFAASGRRPFRNARTA